MNEPTKYVFDQFIATLTTCIIIQGSQHHDHDHNKQDNVQKDNNNVQNDNNKDCVQSNYV